MASTTSWSARPDAMTRMSLAELAAQVGTAVPCAGNMPVIIDDPQTVWFVDQGTVDLFLVEFKDGTEQAAPQHLLRADAGRLLPGVACNEDDTTLKLLAKGHPGTLLKRLPASKLSRLDPDEFSNQADLWVTSVTDTLCRFAPHRPRPTALVEPNSARAYSPGTLCVRRGVLWVPQPAEGASLLFDLIDPAEVAGSNPAGEAAIPLTPKAWLSLFEEATLSAKTSTTLAKEGGLLPALASFHMAAFALERVNRRLAVVDQANLEHARTKLRHGDETTARRRLFDIYDQSGDQAAGPESNALMMALRIVGGREGIEFNPPNRPKSSDIPLRLADVLDASGVRARQVSLNTEDRWWRGESTAILAFRAEDEQPVALVPKLFGGYRQIDPVTKRSSSVSLERARALKKQAWVFYPSLSGANATPAQLLRIGLKGSGPNLMRLVITGILGGLIQLAPAIALGFVANHIVAGGTAGAIYTVAVALAGLGLVGALLHLLQRAAMSRIEGHVSSRVEAAYWDRLMRLPPSVLHRYPAGSLAMSGMSFQGLRDGFQGLFADSFLSFLFLLPVFIFIYFYDATLGTITLVFSLASLVIAVLLGLRQTSPNERMINAVRNVVDQLLQTLRGIAKLRVENAEGSAFATWARNYREQKHAELEVGTLEGHMQAFGAALPFVAGAVLLFAAAITNERDLLIGDFLVVFTLFLTFQGVIGRLGQSVAVATAAVSSLDQMRPLLAAIPETESEGEPVESLGGDILLDQVSFRYEADGPPTLDKVTIRAHPGEFIAIAGASGAGKSTLFRLALGLAEPSNGAVYYDGRDIRHLNLKQLRRHIGTVPQTVQLHPLDIWDNIAAHHQQTTSEEVWQAAELSDIQAEISAMPMGMMTPVDAGSNVLSGGESQRLTIARSLVNSPRVVLLDEATNWLDNESQAKVMQNLGTLTATRIVIAHRLSTLQQADRIYVLKRGKIVQCGSFQELMEAEGTFADLVSRQVV